MLAYYCSLFFEIYEMIYHCCWQSGQTHRKIFVFSIDIKKSVTNLNTSQYSYFGLISSKQGSQTRTSRSIPIFGMMDFLEEQELQKTSPQARQ